MKKSELLNIIKEEIENVLREESAEDKAAKDAQKKALEAQIKATQTKLANLAKGNMNEVEELNEMPFIGGEKGAELFSAIKSSAESLKSKFPEATANDISKIILSKKKRPEFAPEVEAALVKQEEEFGDDPNYNPNLGGPQTLKAVEKALGLVEPSQRGRKSNPDKPTPSKKEKSTKVEKPTTVDKSDDLFDDEGNKIEVDKTIKVATGDKEIEAKLKDVISKKKAKLASGENYDKEVAALKQFLSKPEISKYIKKKTVGDVNPYSIDAILADVK